MNFLYILMDFLIACCGACLRRLYGGGWNNSNLLASRGFQTCLMIALMLMVFWPTTVKSAIWSFALVLWLQFQFWSRGHGCCFDIGRDTEPSESTVERYYERWYAFPIDWLYNKFQAPKYDFLYDFLYMFLRYTGPVAVLSLVLWDWHWLWLGLPIAPFYAFCHTLFERSSWVKDRIPEPFNYATGLAEGMSGFWFWWWLQFCPIPS